MCLSEPLPFSAILELVQRNWNHDELRDSLLLRAELFVSEWRGEDGFLGQLAVVLVYNEAELHIYIRTRN